MRAPILPSFHKGDEVRIEQLLVWAYREQMVHAARPEEGEPVDFIRNNYRPGWASGSNLGGMRVDEGGIRVAFTAHADAYSVDRAVSALGNVDRRRSTEEISIIVARRVLADVALARQRRARGDGTLVYEDRDCVELVRLPALVRAHAMAGTRPIPKLSEATHARAAPCVWLAWCRHGASFGPGARVLFSSKPDTGARRELAYKKPKLRARVALALPVVTRS